MRPAGGPVKLGTLLLRDAVISLAQLEAALRAQVLYGGRLGTNLVELGFIDVDTLGSYLGRIVGTPVATKERFEDTPPEALSAFGADLAELYLAFPLGDDGTALAVAFADPTDETSIDQLSSQCGRPIVPHVAPELRLYYYLEKHYGLTRKARFLRAGTRQSKPDDERRRTQPPAGMEMPPAVRFEPKKPAMPAESAPTPAPAPRAPVEPQVSLDDVLARIDEATTRNQIGDAVVEYAIGRVAVLALFLLRDANAIGWRIYSAESPVSTDDIEKLSLPLGGASVLQAAHDSRGAYRGPALTAGRPVETKLWGALRTPTPPIEMLVVPVLVKSRVVNLLYTHSTDAPHVPDELVDTLTRIAQHAAAAYTRLIKRAKTASDEG